MYCICMCVYVCIGVCICASLHVYLCVYVCLWFACVCICVCVCPLKIFSGQLLFRFQLNGHFRKEDLPDHPICAGINFFNK